MYLVQAQHALHQQSYTPTLLSSVSSDLQVSGFLPGSRNIRKADFLSEPSEVENSLCGAQLSHLQFA